MFGEFAFVKWRVLRHVTDRPTEIILLHFLEQRGRQFRIKKKSLFGGISERKFVYERDDGHGVILKSLFGTSLDQLFEQVRREVHLGFCDIKTRSDGEDVLVIPADIQHQAYFFALEAL